MGGIDGKHITLTVALWESYGSKCRFPLFPGSAGRAAAVGSSPDWNRTAVRQLIFDAEDTLAALDDALKRNDQKELARAIRNGRRAYKELVNRRKSHTLTPLAAAALEQLLSKITARIHAVRDRLMYRID